MMPVFQSPEPSRQTIQVRLVAQAQADAAVRPFQDKIEILFSFRSSQVPAFLRQMKEHGQSFGKNGVGLIRVCAGGGLLYTLVPGASQILQKARRGPSAP